MKSKKILFIILLVLLMTTKTACSNTFMGKTAKETFSDPDLVRLIDAADEGDAVELKALIQQGVDINGRGDHGMTPALWALSVRDNDALKLLLTNGANPNAFLDNGELSIVHIAAGARPIETLTLVLDSGGDPNLVINEDSNTPLMDAIAQFRFDNADLLIARGANINQHTSNGNNAPSLALTLGNYDYALKLLELGYNNDLVDLAKDAQIRQVSEDRELAKQKVIAFLKKQLGDEYPQLPQN